MTRVIIQVINLVIFWSLILDLIQYSFASGNSHFCKLIWPDLSHQRSLERSVRIIDGIREIQRQEQEEADLSFLSQDLKEVMMNAENIIKEFRQQPK